METKYPKMMNNKNIIRLNRIMQYGNSHEATEKEKIDIGLNRTMQYGNDVVVLGVNTGATGLNRTMQYGNSAYTPHHHRGWVV